jgi:hypothetical protein
MDGLMLAMQVYLNTVNASQDDIYRIVEEIAVDTYRRIQEDTPVATGKAQAGWELENMSRPGKIDFVFLNDVPYIVWLEYGHSDQAPRGMLRINLQKAKVRVKNRTRGYLRRRGLKR